MENKFYTIEVQTTINNLGDKKCFYVNTSVQLIEENQMLGIEEKMANQIDEKICKKFLVKNYPNVIINDIVLQECGDEFNSTLKLNNLTYKVKSGSPIYEEYVEFYKKEIHRKYWDIKNLEDNIEQLKEDIEDYKKYKKEVEESLILLVGEKNE